MSENIDRTYTFDLNNQPGINNNKIRRSQIIEAAKALGVDPMHTTTDIIIGDDYVQITALLKTTEGHKVLAHHGPSPEDGPGPYLKHTYRVPIVDDAEDMSPGEYYAQEA